MKWFGFYDILLVVVVSVQSLTLAYLYRPKWKAFVLSLPIPFTCATLALGQPIDATNVLGLLVLLGYVHGVRILHQKFRTPILFSIIACSFGYCLFGWGMAKIVPSNSLAFWSSCIGIFILAAIIAFLQSHREEPGHRTSLPVWKKLPIILGVVILLLMSKSYLRGFMTTFPLVTVIASYETRHSLWTICWQVPMMILAFIPLLIVCRVAQSSIGLGPSLALGWIAFLAMLLPLTRSTWLREKSN